MSWTAEVAESPGASPGWADQTSGSGTRGTSMDEEAFDAFYQASFGRLVGQIYAMCGSVTEAQDCVQEAFIRVHRRWERVEHPHAYLRRAVVNQVTSHHRRRRLEIRKAAAAAPSEEQHQPVDELRDVIRRLPARQRTAVVLRYYVGLPEAEIAATMGCGVTAVKSLLHRALRELRKVVER